ncbi:hypothetical protein [Lichenibacterium ramalinae]|uniref:hypothetical protein n=1 Tax=Lichenibacterium ramalinae TaxID=2316527 RepID=UPI00100DCEE8|nr:hypothetical protein [Lichenibacterium ramalinae]
MDDLKKALLVGWLMKLKSDPIGAIEGCKADSIRSELTENKRKHQVVAFIVGFVRQLASSSEAQNEFFDHNFWPESGHKPSANKLPILTCRFILGAAKTRGTLYQQALSWSKAVTYYVQHGTEPEAVVDHLGEHKLHRVIDHVERMMGNEGEKQDGKGSSTWKPKTSCSQLDESVDENWDGPSSEDDSSDTHADHESVESADEKITENEPASVLLKKKTKRHKDPPFDRSVHIYFVAGAFRQEILDTPAGSYVQVTLRRVIWPNPWKRFEAVGTRSVSWKPSD